MTRMSHSQAAQLGRCGWQHYLSRTMQITETPSLALVGGSAFHEWVELYELRRLDLSLGPDSWEATFERFLAEEEKSSGMPRGTFKKSGRRSKEHPDKETIDVWVYELGPQLVELYQAADWGDWRIATDLPRDSSKAGKTYGVEYMIELRDPHFVMYADQIRVNSLGNHSVWDVKTGQRIYTSAQIPEYVCAAQMHGVRRCAYGGYYHARKGTLDGPHVCKWSQEVFVEYVTMAQRMVESDLRLPVIDDHCQWCGVRESCAFAP